MAIQLYRYIPRIYQAQGRDVHSTRILGVIQETTMRKLRDLSSFDNGRVYGQCTVIGRDGQNITLHCHACGSTFVRARPNVKTCKSCGCLEHNKPLRGCKEQAQKHTPHDKAQSRVGSVVGEYTLVEFVGFNTKNRPIYAHTRNGVLCKTSTLAIIQTKARMLEKEKNDG